jgi:integrase
MDQSELSPTTVAVYLGVIKQVLDFADLDRPNAARHRSVRVPGSVREVLEPPSRGDYLALRSAMPAKWHAVRELLEQTGPRVGEPGRPEVADIDVRGGRLRVRGTKTRAARRWVPLMPETLTLLEAPTPAHAPTALAPVVDPALTPAGPGRAMLRASQVAGIAHTTPHHLRHRYISLLVMAGVPLPLIRQVVGHGRASITLDVYPHVLLAAPEARLCALRAAVMRSGATPVLPEQLRFRPQNDESPAQGRASAEVEHSGFEPLTSWVRSRRSPS